MPDLLTTLRLKPLLRTLLARYLPRRMMQMREDDVWLVSYPKSGNTWTRFLVANLLCGENESVDFTNIERRVPDIYKFNNAQLAAVPSPRTLKSHEYFDPRYRKVILIVRDPRDVLVSYYHHHIKFGRIPPDYSLLQFAQDFVAGRVDTFGSWAENTGSWLGAREHDAEALLLLRYEDMLQDPLAALRRIVAFLGMDADPARLERVVEASSAERMRELEKKQSGNWKATRNTRQDKLFVRAAKSGGWQQELPAEAVAMIESRWGTLMRRLGYLPAEQQP
jgi:hypothetical protein